MSVQERVRALVARQVELPEVARRLGVPFARVLEVLERSEDRPGQVYPHAVGQRCACGAAAVDVWRGRPICAACLCPEPTAAERAAEWHAVVTRGETALARWTGGDRAPGWQELRQRLDRALARHRVPELGYRDGILFGNGGQ
jgi:hypothetical protein